MVFRGERHHDRAMSENTVNAALRAMGFSADEVTGHGFRATARTMLHERLGFSPDVIEAQLAHTVRDSLGPCLQPDRVRRAAARDAADLGGLPRPAAQRRRRERCSVAGYESAAVSGTPCCAEADRGEPGPRAGRCRGGGCHGSSPAQAVGAADRAGAAGRRESPACDGIGSRTARAFDARGRKVLERLATLSWRRRSTPGA